MQLTAQDVEIVRRRRTVRHDPVVLTAHLQESFETRGRVFGALPFEPMRQQRDQTRHPQPFAFARADELVEHDLRAVGKVAKLRLPQGQRVGFGQRIAIFKAQHRIFRQHRVDHFVVRLSRTDVIKRIVPFFGFLVDKARVTLAECPACCVLTGQAHRIAFGQQ